MHLSRRIHICATAFSVIGLLVCTAAVVAKREADDDSAYREVARFTRALEQIRARYVDPSKTSYSELVDGAIAGMLQTLDVHSEYLPEEAIDALQRDTEGTFSGIGVVVDLAGREVLVSEVVPGAPAERSGIRSGDRIISIDGRATEGISLTEAVSWMRGKSGTRLKLSVRDAVRDEVREVVLKREAIQFPHVRDAEMLSDRIGYVRVTQFSESTASQLRKELDALVGRGASSFIIDLRNNPGGLLNAAIEVSQLFLDRGLEVVSTLGRESGSEQRYTARGRKHYSQPVALLVNRQSASAAEIFAGAMQDHKRAILVGDRTYGKASVQSVVPLADGTALRLTTGRYYTPSHRPIHEKGIDPDIDISLDQDDELRLLRQPRTVAKDLQRDAALRSLLDTARLKEAPDAPAGN